MAVTRESLVQAGKNLYNIAETGTLFAADMGGLALGYLGIATANPAMMGAGAVLSTLATIGQLRSYPEASAGFKTTMIAAKTVGPALLGMSQVFPGAVSQFIPPIIEGPIMTKVLDIPVIGALAASVGPAMGFMASAPRLESVGAGHDAHGAGHGHGAPDAHAAPAAAHPHGH